MDEKHVPSRKSSSSGDKGKKTTKKRKKAKAKDAKRNGKSSGTPDGETNSDSAIDAVRRKLLKGEGNSTKSGTKTRKTKEKKISATKVNSPVIQDNIHNQKNLKKESITLQAIHSNLNLTSTTNLIKASLTTTNASVSLQNGTSTSPNGSLTSTNGGLTSTKGGLTSMNGGLTSARGIVHGTLTSSSLGIPLHYTSILEDEDEDSTSSDSDISIVVVKINESLRWENQFSDEEKEKDRIQTYKLNRRKRYLAELIKKRQDKESILRFAQELTVTDDDYR